MHAGKERKKRVLAEGHERYSKVSHRAKILLLKKVICDRQEIKETAEALEINYSTAKTLMRKFKTQGEEMDYEVLRGISNWYQIYSVERQRCTYKFIQIPKMRGKEKGKRKTNEDTTEADLERKQIKAQSVGNTPIDIFQQVLFRQ